VVIVVSEYFFIDSVRKLLDMPSYVALRMMAITNRAGHVIFSSR